QRDDTRPGQVEDPGCIAIDGSFDPGDRVRLVEKLPQGVEAQDRWDIGLAEIARDEVVDVGADHGSGAEDRRDPSLPGKAKLERIAFGLHLVPEVRLGRVRAEGL